MNHSTEEAILEIRDMLRTLTEGKSEPKLREGVKITSNGKYYEQGKGFIKKENAYA